MITLATVTDIINQVLPEPHAGLLNGILFGVKATIDPGLKNSLLQSGTLHIIALSGMNISILVTLVNLALLRFIRRPIANVATVAIIIGFIWFVGPSPSVIRAGIMGTISLLAVSMGKQAWPLYSWVLAVTLMLLLNPLWIADTSFQLSVMATLGIILFGKSKPSLTNFNKGRGGEYRAARVVAVRKTPAGPAPSTSLRAGAEPSLPPEALRREASRVTRLFPLEWALDGTSSSNIRTRLSTFYLILYTLVADNLRVTLAAQVFTIPIIILQFHRVSLISPLTNVLIGSLIEPVTVLGLALVAAGVIWMPLATVLAWITWVPLQFIILMIVWTGRIPFASFSW